MDRFMFGEGADEFFGGYNMYRNAERYGENLKTFYVGNTNIMKEDEKKKILKKYDPDVLPIEVAREIYEETEGLDPLSKMSDVDIQIWLEGDIYLNVDKMSTAAGLEIRMPLTDRRIFDIASRMPSRFKVNEEQNKVAFRTAAAKVLPEEIRFFAGYSGWEAGQLEREMAQNAWLSIPALPSIVFETPPAERLQAALAQLGIDPFMLSGDVGHA